jgi:hypothetical protein
MRKARVTRKRERSGDLPCKNKEKADLILRHRSLL